MVTMVIVREVFYWWISKVVVTPLISIAAIFYFMEILSKRSRTQVNTSWSLPVSSGFLFWSLLLCWPSLWLLQFLPTDNVDRVVGIVKNSLAMSVRAHLLGGGGCAEFARITCRHICHNKQRLMLQQNITVFLGVDYTILWNKQK